MFQTTILSVKSTNKKSTTRLVVGLPMSSSIQETVAIYHKFNWEKILLNLINLITILPVSTVIPWHHLQINIQNLAISIYGTLNLHGVTVLLKDIIQFFLICLMKH